MFSLGAKYSAVIGAIMVLFVQAVACGSQFYKVPLKEDTRPGSIPAAAEDPSSPTYGLHAPGGWTKLPIHFRVGHDLTPLQQKGLTNAMKMWEVAVGKKLFVFEGVHAGVTGDTFKDLYSSLDDNVNGHYRDDHWDKTGKEKQVLATTIWDNGSTTDKIVTADIRFNTHYYDITDALVAKSVDGDREIVDMETLALHELGHLLGLAHIRNDSYSIMSPSLYIGSGLSNRRLSEGDVKRIHMIYGCANEACDVKKTLARLEKMADPKKSGNTPAAVTDTAH